MNTPTPLRIVVAAIAVAALLAGFSIYAHDPMAFIPAIWFGIIGIALLIGVLFERVRYKHLVRESPAGSSPTQERFIDPASGKLVQVYFNAATGERSYVEVEPVNGHPQEN